LPKVESRLEGKKKGKKGKWKLETVIAIEERRAETSKVQHKKNGQG